MNLINKDLFLIISDNRLKIQQKIDEITTTFDELVKIDDQQISLFAFKSIVEQSDLFNAKKIYLFKNVNWFESLEQLKNVQDLIDYFFSNHIPIIITTELTKISTAKKIQEIIAKFGHQITFISYSNKNAATFLKDELNERHLHLDKLIVATIIQKTNFNINYLNNELNKLELINDSLKNVNLVDIDNFICDYGDYQIFSLLNLLYQQKTKELINLINKMLIDKIDEVTIINMMATMMSTYYLTKYLDEKKYDKNFITNSLNQKPFVVSLNLKLTKNYSAKFLYKKLCELLNLEIKIKENKIDKYFGLMDWVLNF
ncbi:DNA polymerase III subunit delta [Ureaplasma urealyticum]|uniref:DNA-directed DNA polymerase n=1 Tax=Ureaplasma urealyticum TaxID=2130 RepID=A0AAX1QZN2_UREUR|nr:DNA polymerase III subunit delta [Ureaplasma urealyticum]RCJ01490.1 DNA polymerase III subunit delta [Ureaplasma urealyticum]UNT66526.1 DNA polymerase III subunit delta [Ureaplasma urealyticum]